MIKIFDVQNGAVIPTVHCHTIPALKRVMNVFAQDEEYLKIFLFLHYLHFPTEKDNPFFHVNEDEKEQYIYDQLECEFSLEDEIVLNASDLIRKMFETPTKRAYLGLKTMLDRLGDYMTTTKITHGRDGNITALVNAAAKYQAIRASFKDAYKDLEAEQEIASVHGKQRLGYDQM